MAGFTYFYNNIPTHLFEKNIYDKDEIRRSFFTYDLIRLHQMFSYHNLPDTLNKQFIETQLLLGGHVWITEATSKKYGEGIYAVAGNYGGQPDSQYRPTLYVWAQPDLGSRSDNIDYKDVTKSDGILILNDSMWYGLASLLARYSGLKAESLVTMRMVDINLRTVHLISTPDDKTKASAELYLKSIERGEQAVLAETRLLDGIRVAETRNTSNYMHQFIEYHQYITAMFYNEIGLNSNFNMKEDLVTSNEISLNEDTLLPLCENMLATRRKCFSQLNEKYGLDVEVTFNSTWLENVIERLSLLKNPSSQTDYNGAKNGGTNEERMEELGGNEQESDMANGQTTPDEPSDSSIDDTPSDSDSDNALENAIEQMEEELINPKPIDEEHVSIDEATEDFTEEEQDEEQDTEGSEKSDSEEIGEGDRDENS